MSDNRNHSPSNPSCLAPLSLVARSRPLTQPVQSLYPLCMYIGKRHIWERVLSFGLMPHGIQTNSPKRRASFALFATNEATHISRFGGMSASRIHSPSNPSCLAPCLWSPGLTHHSPCTVSLSTMHVHWRATHMETGPAVRFAVI